MSGYREAVAKLSTADLEKIAVATLTGKSVDEFSAEAKKRTAAAKDPRGKRPYTELTYQRMQEAPKYLRANGYKTYIVTGGGQDFVRTYSERVPCRFRKLDGDQQTLEYAGAGDGARFMMLVLHDDAKREYAYGPATGLPDSKVGTFAQALYDGAKKNGWAVISMKYDWKRAFAFEP